MELTKSYSEVFAEELRRKFEFGEVRNASAVLAASCPQEWKELCEILKKFQLKTRDLMTPGGNKSLVVQELENLFYSKGWEETRVDTEEFIYQVPRKPGKKKPIKLKDRETRDKVISKKAHKYIKVVSTFQEGYLVDALKGRLAVDIEWNAKDGNLDRDLSAYRAWYELGLIDGAVLITKEIDSCRELVHSIWDSFCEKNAKAREEKIPVDLGTATTTSTSKAMERIKRGDAGGCPILVVGITDRCWDGKPLEQKFLEK